MFHVGDVVEFKTWDEMEAEFGINEYDSIDCTFHFTPIMEDVIDRSKTYTITRIDDDDSRVYFSENPCEGYGTTAYSTDMIKLVEVPEDYSENIIDTDKWKINTHIPNFDYDIEVRNGKGLGNFVDIIRSVLLNQDTLFVSIENLVGEPASVIKYYKKTYANAKEIVAVDEIGCEYFEGADCIKAEGADVKLLQEDNVTLLFTPKFSGKFCDGDFINAVVNLLSVAFPTDDEELLSIRKSILSNDEVGVKIRDDYIKRSAEIKRKRIMNEECDRLGDIILGQRARELNNEVDRITAQLEEAKRQYYNYLTNLEEAKKNLSYFKYVNADDKESDIENIIRADIESGELINFRANGDTLYFKIVEPLLYFDEDNWQRVKDGVISETGQKAYEPILDAIFTRKCTLTIEQGASMSMVSTPRPLHSYQWREGRSLGIPNSHMERYDCWDDNEGNALEYIINGDYDSAYIQMKSAIAGINVCDSPVIYEFCRYMDTYSCIRCITDNETGQLFTIEEANEYYKELAKGEAA